MNNIDDNQKVSKEKEQNIQYTAWKEDLLKRLENRSYFQLSDDEIIKLIVDLGQIVRTEGFEEIENIARDLDEGLLYTAVRLVADGTDPAITIEILKVLTNTLIRNQEIRYNIVFEGTMCIYSGDPPNIMDHKIGCLFVLRPLGLDYMSNPSLDEIKVKLQQTLFTQLHFEELLVLFCEINEIARQNGLDILSELVDYCDEDLLKTSLSAMADHKEPNDVMEILLSQIEERLQLYRQRYTSIIGAIFVIHNIKNQDLSQQFIGNEVHELQAKRLIELEREIETAQELQLGLLPDTSPDIIGFNIAGRCIMAERVGGDFFHYFARDERSISVCIADVTGHGMKAAIPMVMFSGILKNQMEMENSFGDLLARLNKTLCGSVSKRTFVCFTIGQIDLTNHTLKLVNAGCPYPFHYRAQTADVVELPADAYPLGVKPNIAYKMIEVQLEPGDYIVLTTDGIIEADNERGEIFGFDRTTHTILQGCKEKLHSEQLIDRVINAVREFTDNKQQGDDMTCVVVRVE